MITNTADSRSVLIGIVTVSYTHLMFEKGKDTTEYYLLTKDYVSVSEFEGNPILKIEKEGLTADPLYRTVLCK